MKELKRRMALLIVSMILLFMAGLTIVYFEFIKKENSTLPEVEIDKLPKTQLVLKISAFADFENSDSEASMYIENKIENNYEVVVKIYLEDDENGEPIYKTKKLKPGESIQTIKLNRKLNKGSYKAIAYFCAYDDENKEIGKSGAKVTLNIKN